jgi:hypothetical protein
MKYDYLISNEFHISVSSFHATQDSCLGADNGDVYVELCNLRPTFWERSFLHISITSSRSFLHNGIWYVGTFVTN